MCEFRQLYEDLFCLLQQYNFVCEFRQLYEDLFCLLQQYNFVCEFRQLYEDCFVYCSSTTLCVSFDNYMKITRRKMMLSKDRYPDDRALNTVMILRYWTDNSEQTV